MLEKKEIRICKFLINNYKKKLNTYIKDNTKLNPKNICNEYIERFYKCMNNADMGKERGKFISYLNIYSGLCAYEILRENGLSENEGIEAYNKMCASMRKLSAVIYKIADKLPNGYNIVVNSLKDDLNGAKAICWNAKVLKDDDEGFTYEISKCLYFDTCKAHGYPEFCKVFCTHDWYAYGVLKKRSKFVRKSTIAEDGTVCNDTILKLK